MTTDSAKWPRVPRSRWTRTAWHLPTLGRLTLVPLTQARLEILDAEWAGAREPSDAFAGLSWSEETRGRSERWLCQLDGEPFAAFAFGPRVHRLGVGPTIELETLEVRPDRRGSGLGALALVLVAKRALELGIGNVVIAAVPSESVTAFYRKVGARQRAIEDWTSPPGLLPFWLHASEVEALGGRVDDFEEQ